MSSIAVIRFSGELDIARKEELRDALVLDASGRGVLIDLGGVTYADSTALAEILRFAVDVERAGKRLAVFVDRAQLQRLIRYAGCEEAFPLFDDRAAALTYLGESP
jgi:stage II sporulation protein AA (anti-sigma F factor antagonist)